MKRMTLGLAIGLSATLLAGCQFVGPQPDLRVDIDEYPAEQLGGAYFLVADFSEDFEARIAARFPHADHLSLVCEGPGKLVGQTILWPLERNPPASDEKTASTPEIETDVAWSLGPRTPRLTSCALSGPDGRTLMTAHVPAVYNTATP
jgi:hypothetical protein